MQITTPNHELLADLFRAEDSLRRRCAVVAARLEIAESALLLLEVACHADASLDDLDTLAEARGIALDTLSAKVHGWATSFTDWLSDLWPSAARLVYGEILLAMRRDIALAASLQRAAVGAGDRRVADWCTLWVEQRTGQADRLALALVTLQRTELPRA
jgi:hypothetical protein